MTNALRLLAAASLATFAGSAASAADEKESRVDTPAMVQRVYDCRTIADSAERLTCYDRAVGALETAQAQKEITIADKETVKKTRRGLFGFSLPRIGLFAGDGDKDEIKVVEAVIKEVSTDRSGRYRLVMEDGAVWLQIDTTLLPRQPKPGNKVRIKVAAMGSYFANVEGQRTIRMKRER